MKSKDLRLLLTLSGGRRFLLVSILGAVVSTLLVIANAFLIASIVVGLIYEHPHLFGKVYLLAGVWIAKAIFTPQFERWTLSQASSMKSALRSEITSRPSVLIENSSTELTTLLVKGANSLDIYIGRFIPQMFGASITPLVIIAILFTLDPLSSIIAVVTLPLIPFFGALIGRYTQDSVAKKWRALGTLSSYFEDSLKGIFTLTIFGRVRNQSSRILDMGEQYRRETMKVLRISFLSALVLELCATISVALIAVSIGLRLVNSSMEFFPGLVVLILAPEVYFPLRNAASLFHASADGVEALTSLRAKLDGAKEIQWGTAPLTNARSVSWQEFHNPFTHAVIPAATLLPGSLTLISGPSGIGKTTFLYNLLGVRLDTHVEINESEIHSYVKSSFLKAMAWVPQSPHLLDGSLRDQFSFTETPMTDSEITAVLARASLALDELPQGLDTHVGGATEKSTQISGGQTRRVAIARALAKNPQILIADEPTADLDPRSAKAIYSLLNSLAESGCIVIVISHDLGHDLHITRFIEVGQQ